MNCAAKNHNIPVIAFSAWSGTGKTTVIEELIPRLKRRGLRVAVIKHDAHAFEIDREGKDSWRFSRAGADITIINSKEKTALIEQRSLNLSEALSLIRDVDLILAEGYNQDHLPRIGISRKATGKGFRLPLSEYIAVITDEQMPESVSLPVFSLHELDEAAEFILQYCLADSGTNANTPD